MTIQQGFTRLLKDFREIPEDERADFLAEIRSGLVASLAVEMQPLVLLRVLIEKGLVTHKAYDDTLGALSSGYADALLNAIAVEGATSESVSAAATAYLTSFTVRGLPKEPA